MEHAHSHTHIGENSLRAAQRLGLSLGLTLAFVVFEGFMGWKANSLALLTDAAHNLTDVAALALSWYAIRLTAQPPHAGKTYGYHRAGILAALVNSSTLVIIALGIFYEAYQRFVSPPEIQAGIMVVVGMVAFLVNLGTAWLVKQGSEHDLNLRSAFVHLMGDVLSTIGAVLAGIAIFFTGMNWLDPLVSVLIGVLILWNAWGILRETVDILLEGTPRDIDIDKMVADLKGLENVVDVHDLHVWSISQDLRAMSAHVVTDQDSISGGVVLQEEIRCTLRQKYGIAHATLQLECVACEPGLLYCDLSHCVGSQPALVEG